MVNKKVREEIVYILSSLISDVGETKSKMQFVVFDGTYVLQTNYAASVSMSEDEARELLAALKDTFERVERAR